MALYKFRIIIIIIIAKCEVLQTAFVLMTRRSCDLIVRNELSLPLFGRLLKFGKNAKICLLENWNSETSSTAQKRCEGECAWGGGNVRIAASQRRYCSCCTTPARVVLLRHRVKSVGAVPLFCQHRQLRRLDPTNSSLLKWIIHSGTPAMKGCWRGQLVAESFHRVYQGVSRLIFHAKIGSTGASASLHVDRRNNDQQSERLLSQYLLTCFHTVP